MPAAPLVLAFGDSLVAGYGLATADGFAAQLERGLQADRPGARVVNAGRSGDTAAEASRRLPRVLSGLDRRPDLAIVQLGPNDVIRQRPPAETRASLAAILLEFHRCDVPTILTLVDPPALLAERARGYAGIPQAVAEAHGATTIPFFPSGVLGRADMVLADRIHPNARAIAAVVGALLPAVLAALPAA